MIYLFDRFYIMHSQQGSVYGLWHKKRRRMQARSESTSNLKILHYYSQQSRPISHIVWTDKMFNFHEWYGLNLKFMKQLYETI